jgi:hypothetical protein
MHGELSVCKASAKIAHRIPGSLFLLLTRLAFGHLLGHRYQGEVRLAGVARVPESVRADGAVGAGVFGGLGDDAVDLADLQVSDQTVVAKGREPTLFSIEGYAGARSMLGAPSIPRAYTASKIDSR